MSAVLAPAHWRDLPSLVAMEEAAHPHDAWSQAAWWAELASPRREYAVLVDPTGPTVPGERAVLGYAGLDHGGPTADVMTITVDEGRRGEGLGRRLMDHLVTRALGGGAEALLLEVRADNTPALALYERTGFDRLAVRRGYYRGPDGPVDAVILRLLLERSADPATHTTPTDPEVMPA